MRVRFLPSWLLTLSLVLCLSACTFEDATEEPEDQQAATPSESAADPNVISVPSRDYRAYDRAALESGRRDPAWRSYAERDLQERMGGTAAAPPQATPGAAGTEPPLTSDFQAEAVPPAGAGPEGGAPRPGGARAAGQETFEQISPAALQGRITLPVPREEGGPSALRAQILLDRASFSPGVIDGYWGKNTEKAVYWFQYAQGLPATGEVDQPTWDALVQKAGGETALRQMAITQQDLQGPFVKISDDVYEQAKLECLCYESPVEKLAERAHSTRELLEKLNPWVDLANLTAGTTLQVPNVPNELANLPKGAPQEQDRGAQGDGEASRQQEAGADAGKPAVPATRSPGSAAPGAEVAKILISKKGFYVQALDAQGKILYHFPSTLGSDYDPSPDGKYRVTNIAFQPDFHYQPELFHEVPDTEPEAHLPPGPNSPVGLVWMALSKPHYGIHGTSVPETIGYTSSHGCIRLTNWDAVFLAKNIRPGVTVVFRE